MERAGKGGWCGSPVVWCPFIRQLEHNSTQAKWLFSRVATAAQHSSPILGSTLELGSFSAADVPQNWQKSHMRSLEPNRPVFDSEPPIRSPGVKLFFKLISTAPNAPHKKKNIDGMPSAFVAAQN